MYIKKNQMARFIDAICETIRENYCEYLICKHLLPYKLKGNNQVI